MLGLRSCAVAKALTDAARSYILLCCGRVCSRRIIREDDGAGFGDFTAGGSIDDAWNTQGAEIVGWDHAWLDAIIGVVSGHDEKVRHV